MGTLACGSGACEVNSGRDLKGNCSRPAELASWSRSTGQLPKPGIQRMGEGSAQPPVGEVSWPITNHVGKDASELEDRFTDISLY